MSDILCTEINGHGVKNGLDQTGTELIIWMFIFTYSLTLSFSLGTKKVVNNSYTVHNKCDSMKADSHVFRYFGHGFSEWFLLSYHDQKPSLESLTPPCWTYENSSPHK